VLPVRSFKPNRLIGAETFLVGGLGVGLPENERREDKDPKEEL
jgi:hypothetical protein